MMEYFEKKANCVPKVCIVDYGMGNVFSILHACKKVHMQGIVSHKKSDILQADALILPGVGAFKTAMERLKSLDLDCLLMDLIKEGKPCLGICLGMQILLEEGREFGSHQGLGILSGSVSRFFSDNKALKTPHVGWGRVLIGRSSKDSVLFKAFREDPYMYFDHSYFVQLQSTRQLDAVHISEYGEICFCAAFEKQSLFGVQFHPEKSARGGLKVFANFASFVRMEKKQKHLSCTAF